MDIVGVSLMLGETTSIVGVLLLMVLSAKLIQMVENHENAEMIRLLFLSVPCHLHSEGTVRGGRCADR